MCIHRPIGGCTGVCGCEWHGVGWGAAALPTACAVSAATACSAALERVLSLVGADVRAWFAQMPRPQRMLPQKRPTAALPLLAGGAGGGGDGPWGGRLVGPLSLAAARLFISLLALDGRTACNEGQAVYHHQ